jgi:hypothetical protein
MNPRRFDGSQAENRVSPNTNFFLQLYGTQVLNHSTPQTRSECEREPQFRGPTLNSILGILQQALHAHLSKTTVSWCQSMITPLFWLNCKF